MKKVLPLFVFSFLFSLFSFNTYAQGTEALQEIYENAQTKVSEIADQVQLTDNDQAVLVRHITAREQSIAKAKVNQQNPNSTLNLEEFIAQSNNQFKQNIENLLGEEKTNQILQHYELE